MTRSRCPFVGTSLAPISVALTSLASKAALGFVLTAALSACGGGQGTERPEKEPLERTAPIGVDCTATEGLTVEMISDFEGGDAPGWGFVEDDLDIPNDLGTYGAVALEQPRCGGQYAARLTGSGYVRWGGNYDKQVGAEVGEGMPVDLAVPFDATGFDGVALWVKQGGQDPTLQGSIGVGVYDRHTWRPLALTTDPELWGDQVCNPELDDVGRCSAFSAQVGLFNEWRLVKVPFSKMQVSVGAFVPPDFDTSTLEAVVIFWDKGAIDFYFDDIMFYKD